MVGAAENRSGCFFSALVGSQLFLLLCSLLWVHYGDLNGDSLDALLHSAILTHGGTESANDGKFTQSGRLLFWLHALLYNYLTSFAREDSLYRQDGVPLCGPGSLESRSVLRRGLEFVFSRSMQASVIFLGHRDSFLLPFLYLFRLLGADGHVFGPAATHGELPATVWANKDVMFRIGP